jgi:hypothetical protein
MCPRPKRTVRFPQAPSLPLARAASLRAALWSAAALGPTRSARRRRAQQHVICATALRGSKTRTARSGVAQSRLSLSARRACPLHPLHQHPQQAALRSWRQIEIHAVAPALSSALGIAVWATVTVTQGASTRALTLVAPPRPSQRTAGVAVAPVQRTAPAIAVQATARAPRGTSSRFERPGHAISHRKRPGGQHIWLADMNEGRGPECRKNITCTWNREQPANGPI